NREWCAPPARRDSLPAPMQRPRPTLPIALALLQLASACAGTQAATDRKLQQLVFDLQRANPGIVRLSVHRYDPDLGGVIVASTMTSKVGLPSHAEDLRAMATLQPVVIELGSDLDVTVPILVHDGRAQACVGIVMTTGPRMPRETLIANARAIAHEIEQEMD